jgi:ABC-type transport system involved in multi-copper enzyme maturation permease subunit
MSATIESIDHTQDAGRHRKPVGGELPPVRGQSFVKLVGIELRKSVDTRSGRVLILAILGLALVALGWLLWNVNDNPVRFDDYLGAAASGVMLLLPIVGVMAMTSEWTQRTALTTFTLSPRRIRVQIAKFVAGIVLSIILMTVVILLTLAGTAIGGAIADSGSASYAGSGNNLVGLYLTSALNVTMGVAFGAVIAHTAGAIVAYFLAPTLWSVGADRLLKEHAEWLDVWAAFGRIGERNMDGRLPETLTAVAAWIVLPIVVGLWLSNRREVK